MTPYHRLLEAIRRAPSDGTHEVTARMGMHNGRPMRVCAVCRRPVASSGNGNFRHRRMALA